MAPTSTRGLCNFLRERYALLAVLFGATLVFISLGPYSNFDTQTEYATASSVLEYGVPFATYGNLINQPTLGFYVTMFFLTILGLSYETGVATVTLFGGWVCFPRLRGRQDDVWN